MNINLKEITLQAVEIVREVGVFIENELGKVSNQQIEIKDHNSLVSYVDKQAEEMLVEQLGKLIPNSGFITEEDTIDREGETFTWTIDPLDGTTNFLYGIPHFSTSVALAYKDELVIGVISDIMRHDMYYAWKGGGAFMNGHSIQVSSRTAFSDCVIATGFPYASEYDRKPYFKMMEVIMQEARGLRRFGSAALDMAYVANGRFDAFYETSINSWDVAGGIVICKEAGAVISDYYGKDRYYNGKSIIVANPTIKEIIVTHTKEFFEGTNIVLF